jgi:molybdopterin converting factor subunit 1
MKAPAQRDAFPAFLALKHVPLAATPSQGYNLRMPAIPQTIRVKVLFFGRLKEILGRSEESVELAEGAPIEALFARFGARHPELARFRASLVASRNQEFAPWTTPLHSGDEVAFLPPVSGG